MSEIILAESATPSTPSTGKAKLFAPAASVPTLGLVDDAGVLGKLAFNGAYTLTVPATGTAALISTGTWTPTIAGSSTPGGHTYTQRQGNYIKIGPLVIASFRVEINVKDAGMAGNVLLTGFPFASKTQAGFAWDGYISYWDNLATSVVWLSLTIGSNTSQADMYKLTAAAAIVSSLVAADIANNSDIFGTVIYEAAA